MLARRLRKGGISGHLISNSNYFVRPPSTFN